MEEVYKALVSKINQDLINEVRQIILYIIYRLFQWKRQLIFGNQARFQILNIY
jgi:hypothetical protein